MLQKITFRVEKSLIERARQHAKNKNTTLNAEFRRWLEQYAAVHQTGNELADLMMRLSYARPGKTFTRDELNE